jgi:hypothetical protein
MDPSEPHLAVDPDDPARLFTVVQATSPDNPFGQELLWRTADRGRRWVRSPVLGGVDNSAQGASGDPVVAAAGRGRVLFGTLTFDFASVPDTAVQDVGTRVSTDGGASFTGLGIADEGRIPLCFFAGSCPDLPPGEIVFVDKPWLAVDTTGGRFAGRAYLVWVRIHFDTTSFAERHELLVATSRDGGRSYGRPVALDGASGADLAGLEELAQLAVRPDGTLDAVWNGLRGGAPVILHASSDNGGRSFSAPEVVTRLRPDASRLGVVTSLAASAHGRLGLCWSQAVSADRYDARVTCTVTDRRGRWRPGREILPRNSDRQ